MGCDDTRRSCRDRVDVAAGKARLPTCIIGTVSALAVLAASPAVAHSWYDSRCCSGRDCHPVPCEQLNVAADGSAVFLPTGIPFFRESVLPSLDAQCHICTSHPGTNTGYGYCAYIRQGF